MAADDPLYCDDGCGELAEITLEDSDDASGYRGEVHLCRVCLEKRSGEARRHDRAS